MYNFSFEPSQSFVQNHLATDAPFLKLLDCNFSFLHFSHRIGSKFRWGRSFTGWRRSPGTERQHCRHQPLRQPLPHLGMCPCPLRLLPANPSTTSALKPSCPYRYNPYCDPWASFRRRNQMWTWMMVTFSYTFRGHLTWKLALKKKETLFFQLKLSTSRPTIPEMLHAT